jgi:hypothetical protein
MDENSNQNMINNNRSYSATEEIMIVNRRNNNII